MDDQWADAACAYGPPTRLRTAVLVIPATFARAHSPAEIQQEADRIARDYGYRGVRVHVRTHGGRRLSPLRFLVPYKRNARRFGR